MKTIRLALKIPFFLIIILIILPSGAAQGQQPVSLAVTLVDGSRILGTTSAGSFLLTTAYGKVSLRVELIMSVDFAKEGKKAAVLLNNGDNLRGEFEVTSLNIKTLLGAQEIPLSLISTITTRLGDIQGGLVLHFSFEDTQGGLLSDKSGHGNNGVVHGASAQTVSRTPFREFDGRHDLIECSNSQSLNMQAGMSILVWMKPTSWGNGQSSCIISKKEDDYSNGFVLYNDGYYPRELNLRIKGTVGSSPMLHSRSAVQVRALQHWAVTYNPTAREARWYKDSNLDTTYASINVGDMTNTLPLHIGHAQTWGGYFSGSLGNLMVYDRALSAEEVKQIYNSQRYVSR